MIERICAAGTPHRQVCPVFMTCGHLSREGCEQAAAVNRGFARPDVLWRGRILAQPDREECE